MCFSPFNMKPMKAISRRRARASDMAYESPPITNENQTPPPFKNTMMEACNAISTLVLHEVTNEPVEKLPNVRTQNGNGNRAINNGKDALEEERLAAVFLERCRNMTSERYTLEDHISLLGGAFNCIIKVKMTTPHSLPKNAILRVSQSTKSGDTSERYKTTAALHALLHSKNLEFNIPKIFEYDSSPKGILKSPYMLMEHMKGERLDNVWSWINNGLRAQIAEQMVDLIAQIETVTFSHIGILGASENVPTRLLYGGTLFSNNMLKILPIETRDTDGNLLHLLEPQTNLKYLLFRLLNVWRDLEWEQMEANNITYTDHKSNPRIQLLWDLESCLVDMRTLGFFDKEEENVLFHWDLHPRNILVQVDPDTQFDPRMPEDCGPSTWSEPFFDPEDQPLGTKIKVTAVLDWDDMLSTPRIISRRPPMWLWDGEPPSKIMSSGQPGGQRICNADPDLYPLSRWDDESGELSLGELYVKRHFDEKAADVLDDFMEDAYGPRGRFLRRIWVILKFGVGEREEQVIQTFLSDWRLYMDSLKKEEKI